jgi:hypothetical protein
LDFATPVSFYVLASICRKGEGNVNEVDYYRKWRGRGGDYI